LSSAAKRDLVFLVADNAMRQVMQGFLGREPHRRLGCGEFTIDPDLEIRVEPTNDPGVFGKAHELLQPYENSHQHAVVMVDSDWNGSPGAAAIREHISERLARGWREFAVIVIEPELEAWLINDTPHLAQVFRCPRDFRQILAAAGHWPDGAMKPPRPKEALEHLRHRHRARATNAEFGKLAAAMSVSRCQDPAFIELRERLRGWFPVVQS
jgi:hypothetical protein